jgi:hypothetical protein
VAIWYIFSFLVFCTKKNLATLTKSGLKVGKKDSQARFFRVEAIGFGDLPVPGLRAKD